MRKQLLEDIHSDKCDVLIDESISRHVPAVRWQLRFDLNANSGSYVLPAEEDLRDRKY